MLVLLKTSSLLPETIQQSNKRARVCAKKKEKITITFALRQCQQLSLFLRLVGDNFLDFIIGITDFFLLALPLLPVLSAFSEKYEPSEKLNVLLFSRCNKLCILVFSPKIWCEQHDNGKDL